MGENGNSDDCKDKVIRELREKILNERLHNIQSIVGRVEDLGKKTYEQSVITNGRLNRLEEADTVNRIVQWERDVRPVQSIYKNKKMLLTILMILYVSLIPGLREYVVELIKFLTSV